MPLRIGGMTYKQLLHNFSKIGVLALVTLGAFSCAPNHSTSIDSASQNISDSLGCKDVKSKVFDSFYEMMDQNKFVPNSEDMKSSIDQKLDQLSANKSMSAAQQEKITLLKSELHTLVDEILSEAKSNPSITWKEQIQKLIEYEMEDQSTSKTVASTQKISASAARIKSLSQSAQLPCVPATTPPPTPVPSSPSSSGKLSQGVKMVFSTAYQSCRVLDLPAMDASTPSVVGIVRTGTHPDGIGATREINNLASVQNTHYYIRGIASESQCAPVRNKPLIYDYGGEPAISQNSLNFFVNAGSGTDVLGVDCSAYISSAIAVAGLRYKPGVDNKAIFVRQTSSKFINAVQSGFTCFDNVTVSASSSVKAGDIIGVSGHVVAIDKVGADPFGLALIKNETSCSSLNYKNFDITITQSSPSKNGIGINKYLIKDYLDESGPSGKMTTAFVEMGKQACLAKFQNKSIKPSSTAWGFLRHKGTPECLAPRITMAGEACTQKCF